MRSRLGLLIPLFAFVSASATANASPIFPSGLAPGSTYFLAFATADTTNSASPDITTYDAFVTAEANMVPTLLALGTMWKVIGSTATDDAITHINVTAPVYNLAGQEIATGSSDLWDGNIDAPINFDQFGNVHTSFVWTGTSTGGTSNPGHQNGLGDAVFGPLFGKSNATVFDWIAVGSETNVLIPRSLYGISGPLEAPSPVPEPSTISLMIGPLLLLSGTHFRRWRHRLTTPKTQSDPALH